jgi:predicted phage terminase large subunit-like protein
MTTLAQQDILTLYRTNFELFATKAFNIVNPGQRFAATGGFAAMAHALSEVEAGNIQRLLITVPPRSGKSLLASIALPAFILGRDPTRRIICASYSGELSAKLARDCRTVMVHRSYGQLFPATVITGKNTETELETAHGGFRYATSVGGTLTGRGGNVIIIDDPMKPDEAMSRAAREHVWEWFTGTVGSRLDNKSEDAMIVVMQRLHVDDLVGRLLDRGGWQHLSLPAIAESEEDIPIGHGRSFVRHPGDVLDPIREPRETLDQVRRDQGSAIFEAQYQQQPVPEEGGLVNWKWFQTYDRQPNREQYDRMVMSWDTAMKDREVNDYSVGIRALIKPRNQVFILDVIRERMGYTTLRKRIVDELAKVRGSFALIEDAGSGTILLQDLWGRASVIGQRPQGDKVVRLQAVTPMMEAGQVYLPAQAPWLEQFKRELLSFPASANDDQVDALSQLLNWQRLRVNNVPLQTTYSRTSGVIAGSWL